MGTFKKVVYIQVRTNKAVSSIYLIHLEGFQKVQQFMYQSIK